MVITVIGLQLVPPNARRHLYTTVVLRRSA